MATPKHVLIVEDEYLIRALLQGMIQELGYILAASVGTLKDAQDSIGKVDFDLAIVDFYLNGQSALSVVEALVSQERPVIVTTGDSLAGFVLPKGNPDPILLKKPYSIEALADALNSISIAKG